MANRYNASDNRMEVIAKRASRLATKLQRRILVRVISLLLLSCVAVYPLAGCGVATLPATSISPTEGTLSYQPGPSATWSSLLARAQEEATKIDGKAVVQWVQSGLIKQPYSDSNPLQIDFIFVRPNGSRIMISMEDTNPPAIVRIHPNFDVVSPPSEADLERYRQLLSTVQLGPREVYSRTHEEGSAFTANSPMSVSIGLYLDENFQEEINVPVAWLVSYTVYGKSNGLGALTDPQRTLGLSVDPTSGVVLKRNQLDLTT